MTPPANGCRHPDDSPSTASTHVRTARRVGARSHAHVGAWILAPILILLATGEALASPSPFRTGRYDGVVPQTEWYSCGPAAVATLLTYYYGVPTTESEILTYSIRVMEGSGQDPKRGITALSLKRALQAKGISSTGLMVAPGSMVSYFRDGGLPLILHVGRPQKHYVLAVGMVDDWIILADPSFGRRLLPFRELEILKGFTGVVLVPIPNIELAASAGRQQAAVAQWARRRLLRLHQLEARSP